MGKQNRQFKKYQEEGRRNGESMSDYAKGVKSQSPIKIKVLSPSEYKQLKRKWRCL
jgi:hypothetical protein